MKFDRTSLFPPLFMIQYEGTRDGKPRCAYCHARMPAHEMVHEMDADCLRALNATIEEMKEIIDKLEATR